MKRFIACIPAFAGTLLAAETKDWSAWQWEAAVEVAQPGMMRVELPPAVLDVARPDLADLRMRSPAGDEKPCLIELPPRHEGGVRDAEGFKVHLVDRTTVIEVRAATAGSIDAAELVSPAHEFLKSVSIEGRRASGDWQTLATREVIFRQTSGAERLRVPVLSGIWESLRFTIHDDRSQPVPFTDVRLAVAGEKPVTIELPAQLDARDEVSGETRLTLDLGARNLNIREIRFEIPDAVFSRICSLTFSSPTPDGGSRVDTLGRCALYRVTGEDDVSTEQVVLPVGRRVPTRHVVATFRNGDSPPLSITRAMVRCEPTLLTFHAPQAGTYQLLAGNHQAMPPDYDLKALRGAMSAVEGRRLTPGPLHEKPDFKVPPELPGVDPAGVAIDLTGWTHRRAIDAAPPGVIRIELDAAVLAGCQSGLGDLRLIQDGRQIPYLIQSDRVIRDLPLSLRLLPQNPQQPTVSEWELALPIDGLPALELTAGSPTVMFARRFEAVAVRKDELGNALVDWLGSADWVKSQGHDTTLALGLGGRRLPRVIRLQTDHGDNPPIALENPQVRFAAAVIVAKPIGTAPISLVYGNPKASAPQYDLRLVRQELMTAATHPARLQDEERLGPVKQDRSPADTGSPWLWIALAVVVIALLSVVARLLPKPADP